MISALTGQLSRVDEDRIHMQVGPVLYELLIPAVDLPLLQNAVGEELTLHTIFYFEGDASRGNLEPRLIGFLRADDKRFFEVFTTVKGIGPKTALRALSVPMGEIAQAIESKDVRYLKGLKGIGARTAELIIAELSGKLQKFATAYAGATMREGPAKRPALEEEAILALMALGERRMDAEHLLERVKATTPTLKSTPALVQEMLRMRMVRA